MKHEKSLYKRRIEAGLCVWCGAVARPGRVACAGCADKVRVASRKDWTARREAVFAHYGRACACCGETHEEFLAVDHLPGTTRRKSDKVLTWWLVKAGFPPGYRILCHNCNMAMRRGRACPHERDRMTI